ncbi:MAG: putative phosphoglycerate mutase [Anaerolineales bacterium]|nr:putative phosphoglycerate mutase [Anaerolineales bacterium]
MPSCPGPPLTPQGVDEAMQLGYFLRQEGVRQLLTSPFERAAHTARIAAGIVGAPVEQEEGLTEWRPGEEVASIRARVWPAWEQACALSQQAGPVALITHGGPISVLLEGLGLAKEILEQHKRRFDRNNPLPPAGVWKATLPAPDAAWDLHLAFVPEPVKPGAKYAIV